MADEERLAKIEETLIEIRERLTRVETKLDSKKNGNSLDLKTWMIIAAMMFGGGAANYGLQSAVQGRPQVQFIPAPIDYATVRPNG
jgi:hypothetical protein